MVGHDHIDTEGFRMTDWLYITSSTVDGDDEFDSLLRQFVEEVAFQSIPIMHAVGKSIWHLASYLSEESYEDSRRWYTIDIIVTEYDDALFFLSRLENPLHCFLHIWHEKWIMEIRKWRGEKC